MLFGFHMHIQTYVDMLMRARAHTHTHTHTHTHRYIHHFIIEDGAITEAHVKNNEPTHQWNLYFPFFKQTLNSLRKFFAFFATVLIKLLTECETPFSEVRLIIIVF